MRCFSLSCIAVTVCCILAGCKEDKEDKAPPAPARTISKTLLPQATAAPTSGMSLQEAADYFVSVASHTMRNYVQPTSYEELLEGALEGMLSRLDPHSSFLTPEEFAELKNETSGAYAGLGLEVAMEEEGIRVIALLEDSPAARAGLAAQDLIVRIHNTPLRRMLSSRAMELLKGEADRPIALTIRRTGRDDFCVTLARELLKDAAVRSERFNNILYVRISAFNAATTAGVREALAAAQQKRVPALQGMLIDLRNNGGGLFEEAAALADLFLDNGTIVSIRTRQGTEAHQVQAHGGSGGPRATQELSIAILMNAGTASSSEIFAGALQDYKRAIILGTESFGKGSVQSVIPLENGSAIKLTTALYYTPKGTAIQQRGIQPDIEIQQARYVEPLDDDQSPREADFAHALAAETQETGAVKQAPDVVASAKNQDYQLHRALDVLQGMILAKGIGKPRVT